MAKYRVTNTIVSGNIDGGTETVVDWYKGNDLAEAIYAMVGGACHGRNEVGFRVLNVSLHIDHSEPEFTPLTDRPLLDRFKAHAPDGLLDPAMAERIVKQWLTDSVT